VLDAITAGTPAGLRDRLLPRSVTDTLWRRSHRDEVPDSENAAADRL
jgi:hypothetical protein